MSFGMIILNQNMSKMQNYVTYTDSSVIHIKNEDVYKDIADDV